MQQIKVIPLKLSIPIMFTLVDDDLFDFLNKFEWYPRKNGNKLIYARTNIEGKYIDMHNLVLPSNGSGLIVDHINGNTLDNQRHNLRLASKSQNGANAMHGRGLSKYKGVSFDKRRNNWKAELMCKGVRLYLGSFYTEIEAAKAYNKAALTHFGEFAKLNEAI